MSFKFPVTVNGSQYFSLSDLQRDAQKDEVLYQLGEYYSESDSSSKNYELSALYYLIAGLKENYRAMLWFGKLLENGLGVEKNLSIAEFCYFLAAANDDDMENTLLFLGMLYLDNDIYNSSFDTKLVGKAIISGLYHNSDEDETGNGIRNYCAQNYPQIILEDFDESIIDNAFNHYNPNLFTDNLLEEFTNIGVGLVKSIIRSNNVSDEDKKIIRDVIQRESVDSDIFKMLEAQNHTILNDFATHYAGITYGNVSNASTAYGEVKFNAERGHGFAAERANHLYDGLTGHKVEMLGDDNAKGGPDRSVDDVLIQSKYCKTGSKCISECFDSNGNMIYKNPDGSPMQIEVPSDKYDDAVRAMEERIRKGQVPGVSDPKQAKNIVRKGHFSYEQAKNIARFGTVESLTYDAVNGVIIATTTLGVTAMITFAVSLWHGKNFDEALENAIKSGLSVGGVAFASAIVSGQLTKAGAAKYVSGLSENFVKMIGPKASAALVNAFRSGTNIYGAAAMKSAQKVLGSNLVTGGATVIILSTIDVIDIFRGRISASQLFKNVVNTTVTVAGGTAGWGAGASAGATVGASIGSIIPGVGTAIGGTVGGFLGGLFGSSAGGYAANKASSWAMGKFIEDDAKEMLEIIQQAFESLAKDYLLSKEEATKIVDKLKTKLTGSVIKDMYSSKNRTGFAENFLKPFVENEVKVRKYVSQPSDYNMIQALKFVLES